jgi:hypothetical protein
MGLVAQTVQSSIVITGEQWIARTPPKRQVEGSNPSEPDNYKSSVKGIRSAAKTDYAIKLSAS